MKELAIISLILALIGAICSIRIVLKEKKKEQPEPMKIGFFANMAINSVFIIIVVIYWLCSS